MSEFRDADAVSRRYTTKQMGDACEMLVAAELTLAAVPALKAPEYWPSYDVIAQPRNRPPQRISVKSRTFKRGPAYFHYLKEDDFEWLAVVILPNPRLPSEGYSSRRIFIIPRSVADKKARTYLNEKQRNYREYRIDEIATKFALYENNFTLSDPSQPEPSSQIPGSCWRNYEPEGSGE